MKNLMGVFCLLSALFAIPASAKCGYRYFSSLEKAEEAAEKLYESGTKYCYTFQDHQDLASCMRGRALLKPYNLSGNKEFDECTKGKDQFILQSGGWTVDRGDQFSPEIK